MPDSNPHENRTLAMLDRSPDATHPPRSPMPSSPRAIHAGDVALMPVARPVPAPVEAVPPKVPVIQGKSLKVMIAIDPAPLMQVRIRDGSPRTLLAIDVGGRRITVDLATKSVRKALATIRENGADNVFAGLQGKLLAGDVLSEAGLAVQVKAPAPKEAA